jgi:hypothetical protein
MNHAALLAAHGLSKAKNYGRTEFLSKYLNKSLWKNPPYIGQG